MKKVLIWKDTGKRDSQAAKTVVKMHLDDHEAGMQLKGILREEIDQKALLRKPLHEELGKQVDFGIFDDMVVLVWTLDDKRMPQGGKVIVGDKQVTAFRTFFLQQPRPGGAGSQRMNSTASTGQTGNVHLQPLAPDDVVSVRAWPPYAGEFAPLDYALRPGGWLDAFPESPTTRRFGIWRDETLVGFSLLTDINAGRAEFYIALHPQETGHGLGRAAIPKILSVAFSDLRLDVRYLKVRVWHRRGIALYERMGFVATGEKTEDIQGSPERFLAMEVHGEASRASNKSDRVSASSRARVERRPAGPGDRRCDRRQAVSPAGTSASPCRSAPRRTDPLQCRGSSA